MSQRFNQPRPMQGQNQMPRAGQQMPVYNQQMPVQGPFQQMNMQGSMTQMPMQGSGAQMHMQGPGTQMPMQGPGTQMPMQGPGSQMVMQRPQAQMPMQGPSAQMPMQGNGSQMPMQGPVQGTRTQMPMQNMAPQMPMHSQNQQMPVQGQGAMLMQGPGQQMAMQGGQMPMFRQGHPQMRPTSGNMPGQRMTQFVPSTTGQFGVVRPPPYTPDMAKDFVTKQQILQREQRKLIEKQRKRMEEEFKHRQFQETQKRLKEFSAIGGRKMDVDSAISSIIGPTDPYHHQQPHAQGPRMTGPMHGPQHVNHPVEAPPKPEAPPPTQEDDFADFMSCPVTSANQMAPQAEPANEKADDMVTGMPEGGASKINDKKEDKKDLTSMMFECSDLTAPKQAKSFKTKTSVKDVQANVRVASFQQSTRSRLWSGDTEQLTELFTLPEQAVKEPGHPDASHLTPPRKGQPGTGHSPGGAPVQGTGRSKTSLPKWLTGEKPVPDVYSMVLEACTRDGEIDTGMLYPILLRSRLHKDVLGHLWTLCNKQTPGQLLRQELFLLLAMVTVAQNKMDINSLDILLQCAEAPVPDLGQHESATTTPPPQTEGCGTDQASTPSHITETHFPQGPTKTHIVAMTTMVPAPATTQDDDFADFKSATPVGVQPRQNHEVEDFGEFKSTPVPLPVLSDGLLPPPTSTSLHKVGSDLIGDEDKYAALRVSVDEPTADPGASTDLPSPAAGSNFADFGAFKDSSSTSDMLSYSSPTSSNQESVFSEDSSSSSTNQKGDDSHNWGFSSNQKGGDSHLSFSANKKTDEAKSSTHPEAEDDFGDFADFRNTSNTSFSSTMTNETPDKMSSLKALIKDKKLYSEKRKEFGKTETSSTETSSHFRENTASPNEDDWEPFVKSSDPAIPSFSPGDGKSDYWGDIDASKGATTVQGQRRGDLWGAAVAKEGVGVMTSGTMGEGMEEEGERGWADFTSAPGIRTEKSGSSQAERKNELPKAGETRLKFDPKKANSLFSQNLRTAQSVDIASTGVSALDTEPPEFPDSPEYAEPDHQYDKFAAFHVVGGFDLDPQNGFSSLAAPYGGFDDHKEPQKSESDVTSDTTGSAMANQKPLNNIQVGAMKTSQSASSFEFSGWKSQSKGIVEDSQSMKSLDLPVSGSQDGSPAGVDSQSVSSLDFGVSEGGKKVSAAMDNKSVGSLDFQSEQQGAEAEGVEEGFGEFSGATTLPEPVKPWATGEAPINQADRYSELMGDPRDSDRHLHCWDKCLASCVDVLRQANDTFNAIDSMSVCREVVESSRGKEYLEGVTEIFRVGSRIRLAMHGLTMSSDDLEEHQKELHNLWNNLISFMANSDIMPTSQSLTFKKALIRKKGEENLSERLCGVCLLDVDIYSDSEAANQESGNKLSYGGRQYHAPCANFWVNCVDSMLPALKIPDLL